MSIEVKNLKGTGKYKACNKGYTSWKDYWIANNNTVSVNSSLVNKFF